MCSGTIVSVCECVCACVCLIIFLCLNAHLDCSRKWALSCSCLWSNKQKTILLWFIINSFMPTRILHASDEPRPNNQYRSDICCVMKTTVSHVSNGWINGKANTGYLSRVPHRTVALVRLVWFTCVSFWYSDTDTRAARWSGRGR